MSRAVVLAAHGSRTHREANDAVRALATTLGEGAEFTAVRAAFHAGSPGFAEVLDELSPEAREVAVVPVMTSRGFYAAQVLPAELGKNKTWPTRLVQITPPVGTHLGMPEFVQRRILELAAAEDIEPAGTTVAVVGHGTTRHAGSREATVTLAKRLADFATFGAVRAVFLEEAPFVEALRQPSDPRPLVVIPFLIGGGDHAAWDIPLALGLSAELGRGPVSGCVDGRRVLCDIPVGAQPGLIAMIRDLVAHAWSGPPIVHGATR